MRALGRLLRLSLAPSAAADVAAGLVLGAGGAWLGGSAPWLLVGSSLGVYHGAMALNDWSDREADARTRPDRPIPSGAVPAQAALLVGLGLVALGVVLAALAAPKLGVWMGIVALLAVFYDLHGRGPLLGPLLLALCRFMNFGAGLVAPAFLGASGALSFPVAPAVLYGAYVFFVSRLGRLEDDEDAGPLGTRPRRYLLAGTLCFALLPALPLLPGVFGHELWPGDRRDAGNLWNVLAAAAVAWTGAFGLARAALATRAWDRARVGACMGMALRRLLVFTAAACMLGVTWGPAPSVVAALALLGYPASYALRKVFPPS